MKLQLAALCVLVVVVAANARSWKARKATRNGEGKREGSNDGCKELEELAKETVAKEVVETAVQFCQSSSHSKKSALTLTIGLSVDVCELMHYCGWISGSDADSYGYKRTSGYGSDYTYSGGSTGYGSDYTYSGSSGSTGYGSDYTYSGYGGSTGYGSDYTYSGYGGSTGYGSDYTYSATGGYGSDYTYSGTGASSGGTGYSEYSYSSTGGYSGSTASSTYKKKKTLAPLGIGVNGSKRTGKRNGLMQKIMRALKNN